MISRMRVSWLAREAEAPEETLTGSTDGGDGTVGRGSGAWPSSASGEGRTRRWGVSDAADEGT